MGNQTARKEDLLVYPSLPCLVRLLHHIGRLQSLQVLFELLRLPLVQPGVPGPFSDTLAHCLFEACEGGVGDRPGAVVRFLHHEAVPDGLLEQVVFLGLW